MLGSLSRSAVAALALTAGVALAGCSSDDTTSGKVTVVASTNVWGSVAAAIAGADAEVSSIVRDPGADPHSYDASPADAAKVKDAGLVVFNGGGYDEFVEKALPADKPHVDAVELRTGKDDDGHGHSHGGADDENEHVWYDIPTVDKVARAIADELSKLDPDHAAGYKERAEAFDKKLHAISDITEQIAKDHPKAPVAQTEPIAHYLLLAAGTEDLTPPEFQEAIEEEHDPSPAAVAATRALFTDKKVRALVYNTQTEDKVTQEMRTAAEAAGIRIVQVTETLPDGLDYIQWQTRNAEALSAALK